MTPLAAYGAAVLLVALAELGDKSQLLALMLVMRYQRPAALAAGMGAGVLANHALAAALGMAAFQALPRAWVEGALILAFLLMAVWLLWSSEDDEAASNAEDGEAAASASSRGPGRAFFAAAGLFFLAEMGDKTQLMALGLGARFETILPVVLGSVTGVLLVNAPVFWGGEWLAARISMVWARRGAAALCIVLAALTAWV